MKVRDAMKAPLALLTLLSVACASGNALAKLPEPSDEAKAKAAEANARAAWSTKVANYQLCQSMDRVAATYLTRARAEGKSVTPVATAACADPGPFSYTPPAAPPAAPQAAAPAATKP